MPALGAAGATRVLVALAAAALCGHLQLGVSATLNSVLVNSNAIKNLPPALGGAAGHPGSAVSAAPGIPYEGGNKYQTVDNYQVSGGSGSGHAATPQGLGWVGWGGGSQVGRCATRGAPGAARAAALERRAQRHGSSDAQVPHPCPPPPPQPYPCSEDEECGTEEYCASPPRGPGAGAQICLACRKRRKRCMRHAMCCPGNYCKNGESPSPSWTSVSKRAACGREANAPGLANATAPPASGFAWRWP